MKNNEIRELSDKELATRIKEEKLSMVKMNLNHAVSPLENPNRLKEGKKIDRKITYRVKKASVG